MAYVLCACEITGRVRDAFIRQGHIAFSCDLFGPEDYPEEFARQQHPEMHLIGDVREFLVPTPELPWALLIGFPPCTYLTNAGVRHLHSIPSRRGELPDVHGDKRIEQLAEAIQFFLLLKHAPIPHIALENPIMHGYAREQIGDYSQIIQPWQFGHGETKATCLWLKNLPLLTPTNIVSGREHFVHKESKSPNRAMERSRTPYGIAEAMAKQWGPLLT